MMRLNLSEVSVLADRVKRLLMSISALSPDALPELDALLSDKMIVSLLKTINSIIDLQALEIARVNSCWWEDQYWLINCLNDKLTDEVILSHIRRDLDDNNGKGLNGITFGAKVYDWDSWVHSIENGYIALPHCLFAWDLIGDLDANVVFDIILGNEDGIGVLGLSLAPFMGDFKKDIKKWDTPKKALEGVGRFPLLANIALYYSIPGLWPNAFMGAAEKSVDENARFWPWEDLSKLFDQFNLASAVYGQEVKEEDCTPAWLFTQAAMIFKAQSWPEVSCGK